MYECAWPFGTSEPSGRLCRRVRCVFYTKHIGGSRLAHRLVRGHPYNIVVVSQLCCSRHDRAPCALAARVRTQKSARACVRVSVRIVLAWVAIAATGELPAPPTQAAGILCSLTSVMGYKMSCCLGRAPRLRGGPRSFPSALSLHPMVGCMLSVDYIFAACMHVYSACTVCMH